MTLPRWPTVVAGLAPNWFATVMGTGMVAVAAASLPARPTGLLAAATGFWLLAALLLLVLITGTAVQWWQHRSAARGHLTHPITAPFVGAAPMAAMTVGAGALLVGPPLIGRAAAVGLDWILWLVGTSGGLLIAVAVPITMIRRGQLRPDDAFGGWLMPVVPPMVSASTGALLVPHLPTGAPRLALLLTCYTLFAVSIAASAAVIVLVVRRLRTGPSLTARLVPTLWIVLGPLGQSVTAANLLGRAAHDVLPQRVAAAADGFGLAYGVPVAIAAAVWLVVAVRVTARVARLGLPFSLTWWSFTFPVGTCVTGASALAVRTGADLFRDVATTGYAALVGAWLVVAVRTVRDGRSGALFTPSVEQPRIDDRPGVEMGDVLGQVEQAIR